MEKKKISFGFSKLSKKNNIISNHNIKERNKVELVECLEGQAIKVKDAVEEVKQPLVIPIKDDKRSLLDRIRDAKKREKTPGQKNTNQEDNRPDSELSVDELAARQLIREAKERLTKGSSSNENKVSILPMNQETHSLEGEKEPTLEDYESVPISDYGLALLRGMGWKEGMPIGKTNSQTIAVNVPELRPKGLGLGATKMVQSEIPVKKPVDNDGKELILVKGAYAKVIAGVKKGNYCEVQGFDEEAGRVIVKVYPKGEILNVNELMLVPVTKDEFSKGYKILNNAKYEEYVEKSEKNPEYYKVKEEPSVSRKNIDKRQTQSSDENDKKASSKNKDLKHSSHSREKKDRRKDDYKRNKYRSESETSESEYEKTRKSGNYSKSTYRETSKSRSPSRHKSRKDYSHRRSDSASDTELKKRNKHSKYGDVQNDNRSKDRYKNKKHKKARRNSSSSEEGSKRDRKKKSESRHRKDSSSSSNDRKNYKTKK